MGASLAVVAMEEGREVIVEGLVMAMVAGAG